MAVTYSREVARADDDLEFKLRRSIQLATERKANQMATKATKKKANGERAAVSRERRLALALVALLDAYAETDAGAVESQAKAEEDAKAALATLGYGSLEGIPKRVAALNELLKAAVEAGDGREISRLGLELEKAKAGRAVPKSSASVAKSKLSRKQSKADSAASTKIDSDAAGDAVTQ